MSQRLPLHRTLVAIAGTACAFAPTLVLTLALTACSPSSTSKSGTSPQSATSQSSPQSGTQNQARAREQQIEAYARQLDAIPPPAKPRYMAVTSSTHWQNPFLTIQQKTVELRVPAPATRTRRRRRNAPLWKPTTVTIDALPATLAALPQSNWPYGRVIAVRDDLSGPSSAKVQVRRNEEKVLNLLNNLGVVTYEWPQNHKR